MSNQKETINATAERELTITRQMPMRMRLRDVFELPPRHVGFVKWRHFHVILLQSICAPAARCRLYFFTPAAQRKLRPAS